MRTASDSTSEQAPAGTVSCTYTPLEPSLWVVRPPQLSRTFSTTDPLQVTSALTRPGAVRNETVVATKGGMSRPFAVVLACVVASVVVVVTAVVEVVVEGGGASVVVVLVVVVLELVLVVGGGSVVTGRGRVVAAWRDLSVTGRARCVLFTAADLFTALGSFEDARVTGVLLATGARRLDGGGVLELGGAAVVEGAACVVVVLVLLVVVLLVVVATLVVVAGRLELVEVALVSVVVVALAEDPGGSLPCRALKCAAVPPWPVETAAGPYWRSECTTIPISASATTKQKTTSIQGRGPLLATPATARPPSSALTTVVSA